MILVEQLPEEWLDEEYEPGCITLFQDVNGNTGIVVHIKDKENVDDPC